MNKVYEFELKIAIYAEKSVAPIDINVWVITDVDISLWGESQYQHLHQYTEKMYKRGLTK